MASVWSCEETVAAMTVGTTAAAAWRDLPA
jgi:hypothetical protein